MVISDRKWKAQDNCDSKCQRERHTISAGYWIRCKHYMSTLREKTAGKKNQSKIDNVEQDQGRANRGSLTRDYES